MIRFVVFALFLSGCSYPMVSHHMVTHKAQEVNTSDGISKEEAIVLAQNLIVSKSLADRLYTLKPFDVRYNAIWSENGESREMLYVSDDFWKDVDKHWMVLFRDRKKSLFWGVYPIRPFYVKIDADTGKVLGWGIQ